MEQEYTQDSPQENPVPLVPDDSSRPAHILSCSNENSDLFSLEETVKKEDPDEA